MEWLKKKGDGDEGNDGRKWNSKVYKRGRKKKVKTILEITGRKDIHQKRNSDERNGKKTANSDKREKRCDD